MKILGTADMPEVALLPSAGERGRILILTSDNGVYYDNGTAWTRLDNQAGGGSSNIDGGNASSIAVSNIDGGNA
jgi:hypothetical protein